MIPGFRRSVLVLLVVVLCLAIDRTAKLVAREELMGKPTCSCLHDIVRFEYGENQGVLLGMGARMSPGLRFWLFIVLVGMVITALLVYILLSRRVSTLELIGASCLIGGGYGNLLDRILFEGSVIDFITIGVEGFRIAVFNVADVAVIGGIALMLIARTSGIRPAGGPDGTG
jgi:signal peptidase II